VVEKALMSVYGEHFFQSQNKKSSLVQLEQVMHMLTGWIPEVVQFSEVRNTESLFRRMQQNFKDGQICLGLVSAQKGPKTKPQYALPVLDILSANGRKELLLTCPD
jgi:hypothetical protein